MRGQKTIKQVISTLSLPLQRAGEALDNAGGRFMPGRADPATGAGRWPVWRDSTRAAVEFKPIPKKHAARLYHRARDYDQASHRERGHGGRLGRPALAVLHSLIFDFLNPASGRLDPSYEAIARKAGVCRRTAANALNRLKSAGLISWVRRSLEARDQAGRFCLAQGTNAYELLDEGSWRDWRPRTDPPPPDRATWCDHPPPNALDPLSGNFTPDNGLPQHQRTDTMIQALQTMENDPLAMALAGLGAAMRGGNT